LAGDVNGLVPELGGPLRRRSIDAMDDPAGRAHRLQLGDGNATDRLVATPVAGL